MTKMSTYFYVLIDMFCLIVLVILYVRVEVRSTACKAYGKTIAPLYFHISKRSNKRLPLSKQYLLFVCDSCTKIKLIAFVTKTILTLRVWIKISATSRKNQKEEREENIRESPLVYHRKLKSSKTLQITIKITNKQNV